MWKLGSLWKIEADEWCCEMSQHHSSPLEFPSLYFAAKWAEPNQNSWDIYAHTAQAKVLSRNEELKPKVHIHVSSDMACVHLSDFSFLASFGSGENSRFHKSAKKIRHCQHLVVNPAKLRFTRRATNKIVLAIHKCLSADDSLLCWCLEVIKFSRMQKVTDLDWRNGLENNKRVVRSESTSTDPMKIETQQRKIQS